MPDLVGKTLGDFRVEAILGRGSMARVYRSWQASLRRPVALKVLKEELFMPGLKIKRFLREAEALARLEHPHIVPIYAAGEATPYYFFAMRLVNDGTLADAMARGLPRRQAFVWLCQVCRALAYAHGQGVVHRDMKPTNVLVHGDAVLLADFGLARLRDLSTITQQGQVLGTPLYMSPEQTRGEPMGPPADCFALGVLFYQLLTGEHPFADLRRPLSRPSDQAELFRRVEKAEAVPLREHVAAIPPELDAIILRALARRPEDRFADAGAMASALEPLEESVFDDEPALHVTMPPLAAPGSQPGSPPALAGHETHDMSAQRAESSENQSAPKASPFRFDRYEVLSELGHGGQGVVYRARDTLLERDVALKVLQGGWQASEKLLKLLRREACVAASLHHPHIIPILDFGFTDQPFLTMPIVAGYSLDKLIAAGQPVPVDLVRHLLLQTAEALEFAHTAGVLHLNVKPGNVLLQETSGRRAKLHVILTDFTMAKLLTAPLGAYDSRLTSGTIPYASPEQLRGDNGALCPASDLFSLGVILHELLTGRRLFASDDPSVDKMLVLHANVPPPSSRAAGISPAMDAISLKLLQRSPEERFRSAGERIEALEAIES